jgi:putative drug exporter of the RND superfamily
VLARLATFCYRRRWIVLGVWIIALFGTQMAASAAGDGFSKTFSLGGTDSEVATDLLKKGSPADAGFTGDIVFKADAGLANPAVKDRLTTLIDAVAKAPGIDRVDSPYDPQRAKQLAAPGGRIGYASVHFNKDLDAVPKGTLDEIHKAVDAARTSGLQLELGGNAFGNDGPPATSELYGLIAAVFILVIAFGSVLAMGLPILMALFGLGGGIATVGLLAHLVPMPSFASQLASMIGLGVGIDYSLFIVTRYRQGLGNGLDPQRAVVTALDTAGRAVLLAGMTVVISLVGMVLIGIPFIGGLGVGSAAMVLVTVAAALTLLPAVLGFVGHKIDFLSVPGLGRNAHGGREGFWFRWSRFLQRHPWPFAVAGFLLLVTLALPVLRMQVGSSDESSLPTTSTVRRAYDLKAEGFGAGASAPLLLVAEIPRGLDLADPRLATLQQAIASTPGVASVSPPIPNQDRSVMTVMVVPTTSAQDTATTDLLEHLRDDVLPSATAGTGIQFHIGGFTAIFTDLAIKVQSRLPLFIGVVLGLSFLLLMVVFRSIVVPLKAVIMNLLSIGAAYGVVVAVFQFGWLKDLFGLGNTGPVESFLPMMMFAILFGLSMDYEVFLLSRIKEEYDRTGDNAFAVAEGLSNTARVITAAALIMVTVFASFILGDQRVIKEFGLGLAGAIFIDASIARMVLVPATMELLGNANWWFPKWLQWLPTVHVEGQAADEEALEVELAELVQSETANRS